MGIVKILPETTRNPITLMGERAGICWGADITDAEKNFKRGNNCLESDHGRVMEYVNVEMLLDGYSARVIREWYTHIGGAPTRLQASTRYVNYKNFTYITPPKIAKNEEANKRYQEMMEKISQTAEYLEKECNIPREDAAMLLPLGMSTRIVDKRNLRNLVDMSHQRMCNRAYWEFRALFQDVYQALADFSPEWKHIVEKYFQPKCEQRGYCPEEHSCGRFPKKLNSN